MFILQDLQFWVQFDFEFELFYDNIFLEMNNMILKRQILVKGLF